jgi:hypothetical protein
MAPLHKEFSVLRFLCELSYYWNSDTNNRFVSGRVANASL